MTGSIEMVISCRSWQEAQKVADRLLEQKLIARAEFLEANGIQLIMTTAERLYDKIESEIADLLDRESPVIHRLPVV